jgi:hypothetical protein
VAGMERTFVGVGYARDRAGPPLEAVGVPVPRPEADKVLIRVAASSLTRWRTSWPTSTSWNMRRRRFPCASSRLSRQPCPSLRRQVPPSRCRPLCSPAVSTSGTCGLGSGSNESIRLLGSAECSPPCPRPAFMGFFHLPAPIACAATSASRAPTRSRSLLLPFDLPRCPGAPYRRTQLGKEEPYGAPDRRSAVAIDPSRARP